jgi:regulatory protein YycH of two-component signal transduction system YycFG
LREKFKTFLLTVLVLLSLMLSLGIWRTTPQYEEVDGPQYLSNGITDPIYQRSLQSVIGPRALILHYGEEKHTVFFPGESAYEEGVDLLRAGSFFDIRITNDYGEEEWSNIVNHSQSLQYEFDVLMTAPVIELSKLLHFTSNLDPLLQVRTIYLFRDPQDNDWRALFYGGPDSRMYISRVVLPADRPAKLFAATQNNPPYQQFGKSLHKNFYLPANRHPVPVYTAEILPAPNTDRLIDTFFADKTLTRRVLERDGSQIITDGSRSLRVGKSDRMIVYRNLAANRRTPRSDVDSGIVQALNFTNEHGGFSSSDVLAHEVRTIPVNSGIEGRVFNFRQLVNGLPVIGDITTTYVQIVDQEVGGMLRSQDALGKPYRIRDAAVLSGAELLDKATTGGVLIDRNRITDVYLAYLLGEPRSDLVDLQPVYVVELAGEQRSAVFDAVTGEQLLGEEVELRGLE